MAARPRISRVPASGRQQGAVLYVALIMLVLLALLGIIGMQVSGLQERMAANYRNVNAAFQADEAGARTLENRIQAALAGGGTFAPDTDNCTPTFDPNTWADASTTSQAGATHTRQIDRCFPSSSLVVGRKVNEETGNIYQVTALSVDASGTASAVVDTIFVP